MNETALNRSLIGATIEQAKLDESRLSIHLDNGAVLYVSASWYGFIGIDIIVAESPVPYRVEEKAT